MGYYTKYNVDYYFLDGKRVPDNVCHQIAVRLNEIAGFHWNLSETEHIEDMIEYDIMKWYDHDENMIDLSKEFPKIIFMLEGRGEDSEDMWQTYYRDGNMQFCHGQIVFDKPDSYFIPEGDRND